jgi:uncharacterized protein YbjT (DUF2867 family)
MNNNNNRETTILVTGSTGTVGSEVVKRLASSISSSSGDNIRIRAAVHSQNKADPHYLDLFLQIRADK